MIAILLAPVYLLANYYLLRRVMGWVKAWFPFFRTARHWALPVAVQAFLVCSVVIAFFLPEGEFRRAMKLVGNYWLGVLLYALEPSLTILKRNSVTGDVLANAKFHIYYGSDNTTTGEINDLGVFTTDESGKITLTDVNRGWYKLAEESAPKGFGIQGSGVTEFYLEANTSKTVTVDNVPHSALVVYKYDAKTGKGLEGCRFELRYLSGNTSGTGGTVIGTYVTGPNGAFTVTNLKRGTYICQEVESDGNHIIDREPQTVWISGEDQDVATLRFGNAPLGSLLITKLSDDSKHEPLSGVEFLLTDSSGHYLGNDNGRFTTNAAGEILVDGLEPGMTVIAREVRAKPGYLLDDSPQHALIKSGETAHLQFLNQPAGNLIIRKVSSGPYGEPLEGVEFKITYADGSFVPDANGELSSNGIYYTNKSGEIRISGVVGTVVATETKTIPGFTIDEATRTQTVVVNPNDTQTLTFYNKPTTTLILQKYISGTKNGPLAGVQFLVTDSSGAVVGPNNGYYTTDAAGQIVIEGLTDGMTITAKEVKTVDGFVLDGTPQSIKIDQSQSPQRMTFWNERQGALIINKLSSLDRKTPLEGVIFKITTAIGEFVPDENGKISSNGLYYTDENGQIILKGVTGTLVVTEEKSISGYTIDENTRTQTVVVNPNDTQSLYFYNAPIGGLELVKVNAADKTQRIPNTTFEIRRVSDSGLVDTVTTGTDGCVYVPLESGSYISELSKQLNMSCIGATNYSQKTIYLSEAGATLHEFGHFLDWTLGIPAEHEQPYLAEAQNSGLRDYAKTNAREYFADCFDDWITHGSNSEMMEHLRKNAPQTWVYFEALEKNNWRS